MKKHKFNIFPEAKPEDFKRLRDDIDANGYDAKQPITMYEGDVLDGWNRHLACKELKVTPASCEFRGDDSEAIAFVMRSNKRRNMNSGQWATVAVEADAIMEAIAKAVERERKEKQKANAANQHTPPSGKKLPEPKKPDESKAATKAAELFNTNRTYVNQAAKIKAQAPEVFEKVKAGKMTMQDASRVVRALPTEPWLDDEEYRKQQVEKGKTVVANTSRDKNLIQWAEKQGLAVRIDRSSDFGNPFILDADGTRDEVCDSYRDHYLPCKPSIKKRLKDLKGKVLICHCFPERCHGNALVELIK